MADKKRTDLFKDIERQILKNALDKTPKAYNLLLRAKTPQDLTKFHEKCVAKGPTVTVLYGKYNTLFGGYTSKNWTTGTRITEVDGLAFLFYKNDKDTVIIPVSQEKRAITCDAKFGPTFGGGRVRSYDFQAFTLSGKASERKDTILILNGSININGAYKNDTVKNEYINGGTMEVKQLEVYEVVDDELVYPWRNMPNGSPLSQILHFMRTSQTCSCKDNGKKRNLVRNHRQDFKIISLKCTLDGPPPQVFTLFRQVQNVATHPCTYVVGFEKDIYTRNCRHHDFKTIPMKCSFW